MFITILGEVVWREGEIESEDESDDEPDNKPVDESDDESDDESPMLENMKQVLKEADEALLVLEGCSPKTNEIPANVSHGEMEVPNDVPSTSGGDKGILFSEGGTREYRNY